MSHSDLNLDFFSLTMVQAQKLTMMMKIMMFMTRQMSMMLLRSLTSEPFSFANMKYFMYCGAVVVDGVPTRVTPWMDIWAWEALEPFLRQQFHFTVRLLKVVRL